MEKEEVQNQEVVNEPVVQPVNPEKAEPAVEEIGPIAAEIEPSAVKPEPAAAEPERKPRSQVEVTDEMVEKSSKTLSSMRDYLGLGGFVKAEKRPSKINLIITSSDAGRIIGRKGQSLESLQLLLNRMMQKGAEDFPKIYIDIDGYSSSSKTAPSSEGRAPRRGGERRSNGGRSGGKRSFDEEDGKDDILRQQAVDAAKEVRRWGEPVTLPKMNSHDRRIIHITLENESDIHTESVGEGSLKSVVVSLKK